MISWILVIHVFGFVFWVSGLLVTTIALLRHTQETSPEARNALARLEKIFLRGMADPGALLTILAGITMIATNPTYYLHAPWLHIKLSFVIAMIALHIVIAMRTKSYAAGKTSLETGQVRMILITIILVLLLILVSTLPGQVFLP
jgi:protoporphyrinogen IX oxidase